MSRYLQAQSGRKKLVTRELVANGGFESLANWSLGAGWSIAGGKVIKSTGTQTVLTQFPQVNTFTAGKKYRIKIVVSDYTSGLLQRIRIGGNSTLYVGITAVGTYTYTAIPADTGLNFAIQEGTFIGAIESISAMEIVP